MSDLFDEMVLLERIDLIARLSTGGQHQINDRELALLWIAELIEQVNLVAKAVEKKCDTHA